MQLREKFCKSESTPERMCNKTYLRTATESLAKKQFQPDQVHDMEWSGAIRLEIESMLVEIHTDITNMIKQGDK